MEQTGTRFPALDSRAGHLTARVVSPIAVEPDHAPFHTPGHPDHAGIFADRVTDLVPAAVADQGHRGAEAPRDGSSRPGPERDLAHPLEVEDLQVGVPETALLFG